MYLGVCWKTQPTETTNKSATNPPTSLDQPTNNYNCNCNCKRNCKRNRKSNCKCKCKCKCTNFERLRHVYLDHPDCEYCGCEHDDDQLELQRKQTNKPLNRIHFEGCSNSRHWVSCQGTSCEARGSIPSRGQAKVQQSVSHIHRTECHQSAPKKDQVSEISKSPKRSQL